MLYNKRFRNFALISNFPIASSLKPWLLYCYALSKLKWFPFCIFPATLATTSWPERPKPARRSRGWFSKFQFRSYLGLKFGLWKFQTFRGRNLYAFLQEIATHLSRLEIWTLEDFQTFRGIILYAFLQEIATHLSKLKIWTLEVSNI